MSAPKDPIMLLSYLNTQLRDNYSSLDDLALSLDFDKDEITNILSTIDYHYSQKQNQFI